MDKLSISHFDEGSYISSAMTVATEGAYSFPFAQPLQAPPLLPWIIGAIIWLTQAQWPLLGVFVSAAFGTASVPLMFLLARRWGGNQFGLWAASLLAVSDFHVAYSRMVLTDGPLTFWFLLTMYCVTRLWEQAEAQVPDGVVQHRNNRKKGPAPPNGGVAIRSWMLTIGWGVMAGIVAGAAWNTKYNGWLVMAISIFSAGLWIAYRRLSEFRGITESRLPGSRDGLLFGCLLLAAFIAAACYAHWYLFVERHFEGGYAAVTANHRSYFYSPSAWPRHAYRLIGSLAALRHYGWILSMGLMLGLGWRLVRFARENARISRNYASLLSAALIVLGLASLVLIQGADAALILLGAMGIPASLLSWKRERLLAAVWCGTFVVLTPLYHPYPRLMLPALPACICLTLWMLQDIWPGLLELKFSLPQAMQPAPRQALYGRWVATAGLVAAFSVSLIWLLGPHPFGLLTPTRGLWNRWTAHHSYREAGQAIVAHTEQDAVIICQTQLAMISYCQRLPVPAEEQSFEMLLPDVPADRNVYLLADYCWIHGKSQKGAWRGITSRARDLTPVAVIENDVNIVTLLDQMTPGQLAAKLSGPQPDYTLGSQKHSLPVPPPLADLHRDVLVLYRIKLPLSR